MGPSLQHYQGCTIVDINPGVGLFSEKLNQWLRPRKHYLVESSTEYHQLLQHNHAHGQHAKYNLRHETDNEAWKFDFCDHQHGLPQSGPPSSGHSLQKGLNTSILVIANLSNSFHRVKRKLRSSFDHHEALLPEVRLTDYLNSVRREIGVHKNGPVRLLLWADDSYASALLPRTVALRSRFNLFLEAFSHVEQIVGCVERGREGNRKQRDDLLDLQSGAKVADRMAATGLEIPKDRRDEMQQRVQDLRETEKSLDAVKNLTARRRWHRELDSLKAEFRAGGFSQLDEGPTNVEIIEPRKMKLPLNKKWVYMNQLEQNLRTQNATAQRVQSPLLKKVKLNALDIEISRLGPCNDTRRRLMAERDEISNNLGRELKTFSEGLLYRYTLTYDDNKAFSQDPPLLTWDQRQAERLIAHSDDFYSERDDGTMSLFDIQPKPTSANAMTPAQYRYFDRLRHMLFDTSVVTLSVLDFVAAGASGMIYRQVPALTDPRRGGERDMKDLRTRMLTPEMLHGMALAWDRWPYKPVDYGVSKMPQEIAS